MSPEPQTPSEFVDFVRDIGVRSFDYFASRVEDRSPFRKLAAYWSELEADQKTRFFDQLITGAQVLAASAMVTKLARRNAKVSDEPPSDKKKKKVAVAAGEIDDVKEKKKNKKKAEGKKGKNKDKQRKKKKSKKSGQYLDAEAIPSAS